MQQASKVGGGRGQRCKVKDIIKAYFTETGVSVI
jgi:hypothetical protein